MTRHDHRQVIVTVTISVGDATAVNNHGIVEQRLAVSVLGVLHAVEEVSELLKVEFVDLLDLTEMIFLAAMV